MFAGAPLSAIQTVCLAAATPFAIVSIVFIFKSMKWLEEIITRAKNNKKESEMA